MSGNRALIIANRLHHDASSNGVGAQLRSWALEMGARRATQMASGAPHALLLGSGPLLDRVRVRGGTGIELLDYDASVFHEANRSEYGPLHDFADSLYAVAEGAQADLGLASHGLSHLRVLEPRWLDPLFNNILVYVAMFHRLLHQRSITEIQPLGNSRLESIFSSIARHRGVRVRRPPLEKWLFRALGDPVAQDYAKDYEWMVAYDVDEMREEARTSVFDRVPSPRVLFLGTIDRTVERLLAAVPAIRREGRFHPCLLAHSRISLLTACEDAEVPSSLSRDWICAEEGRHLVQAVREAARSGWRYLEETARRTLNHTWHGTSIFECAADVLRGATVQGGARAALAIEVARRVLARCRPALVVSFEENDLTRAFTLLCRRSGIPTLAYYVLSPSNYAGLLRRSPERMAVSGGWLQQGFAAQYPAENLRLVGDALADRAALLSRETVRNQVCEKLGLSAEKPIVLLLSTWPAAPVTIEDIRLLFVGTWRAVSQIPGAQLVVKLHPLQRPEDIKRWMADWHCEGVVVPNGDLLELCTAADLVSVPGTTAVWHPMMARTPVVCIQSRGLLEQYEQLGYDYLKGKGIVHIDPDGDPLPIIRSLLFDPAAREAQIARGLAHVSEHVGPLDGGSGGRLVRWMNEMVESGARIESFA